MNRIAWLELTMCVGIILFTFVNESSADIVQADSVSTIRSGGGSEQRSLSTMVEPVKDNSIDIHLNSLPLFPDKKNDINKQVSITSADGLAAPTGQSGKLVKTRLS